MNIPSKIVEQAVEEFSSLPSIGKRSALRFVLHLLKQDPGDIEDLSKAIMKLKDDIQYCTVCQNISDSTICAICSNPNRDKSFLADLFLLWMELGPMILKLKNWYKR